MKRKYFHYKDLEEFQFGMWKIVRGEQRKKNAEFAAQLMRDETRFKMAMRRVLDEWPNSCQHNLTAENTNRIAWLGHAGCLLATGSPEENTRIGWHLLNFAEQDIANRVAAEVLLLFVPAEQLQGEFFPC